MKLLRRKLEEHWGHEHLKAGKKRRIPKRSPGRTKQWGEGLGDSSVLTYGYFRSEVVYSREVQQKKEKLTNQ